MQGSISHEGDLDFDEGLVRPRKLAVYAEISALVVAGASALCAVSVLLYLNDLWPEALIGTDEFHGLEVVLVTTSITIIVSWFVVGTWIYRAHANLQLTDVPTTEFTPGWAVGWFLVPIANLFKPFQAMKALWRVSHSQSPVTDETAPGILWFWWLTCISSSMNGFGDYLTALDVIAFAATTASAVVLISIIRQITAAQPSMSVASTFE